MKCEWCFAAIVALAATSQSPLNAGDHSGELVAGEALHGGFKVGVAWQHALRGGLAMTANGEWSEDSSQFEGERIYRERLAYVGIGTRYRFRAANELRPFVGLGLGLGKLSYPFAQDGWSVEPGLRRLAWFGLGCELQVSRRVGLVWESRMEFLREPQASIRVGVQVPLRRPATPSR